MALAIVVAEKPSAADAAFVDSYTREEAAAILDVSTVTIRSYVKQGRLLSVDDRHVVDRRERRVTKASVEAFRPREQRQTTGTRVFLKDVRPDLRHWIMGVTDTEFDQIAANSKDAFTFFCTNGHTVQAKPRDYRYVTECAYCTGARIWPGYNDLATRWPAFVQDHWDYERNTLGPSEIGTGYNGKVWLRCDLGHGAHAGLAGRFKSWMDGLFSCDKCRVRIRAIRSGQGLTATHPHLVQQWDSRNELHPWEVMPGSGYRASWVCALGHRWRESVSARARCGMGCPYCSGHRVLVGFNDLAKVSPAVAAQWHSKNELRSNEVTSGSNARVHWLCEKGHEWEAQVNQRKYHGCPRCARTQTSLVERLLWRKLAEVFSSLETDVSIDDVVDRRGRPSRCDAALSERGVVFEYDGAYWHRDRLNRDFDKTTGLLDAGWLVVRVREKGLSFLEIGSSRLVQLSAPVWRIATDESLVGLQNLADQIVRALPIASIDVRTT